MNHFIQPTCKYLRLYNDIQSVIFSFLLYKEFIPLQLTSTALLEKKDQMEKYCQHIHPHGNFDLYNQKTKLQISQKKYIEGKLMGEKFWDKNEVLKYENIYINEDIEKKGWYINGQLSFEYFYKKGTPKHIYSKLFFNNEYKEGIQKEWYSNGQLLYIHIYNNGEKDGTQKYWHENGQLLYEENYNYGGKNGIQKYWHKNGQLSYEENFHYGKLNKKKR